MAATSLLSLNNSGQLQANGSIRLESAMYHPIGSPARKKDRDVYLSDATWDLLCETRRRAKLLAGQPSAANADTVLRQACRLLMRVQDAEAKRLGINLSAKGPGVKCSGAAQAPGFMGIVDRAY
jgi:hypothetical protein